MAVINSFYKAAEVQYSPDGMSLWGNEYRDDNHTNALYPGVVIPPHKYIRFRLDGRAYFENPIRLVGIDGKECEFRNHHGYIQWKYVSEHENEYKTLFLISDYLIEGPRGERGKGLLIHYSDYLENIHLYTPSANDVSNCNPCNEGANDIHFNPSLPIFMSIGTSTTNDATNGKIYAYSFNSKVWTEIPGILNDTGEVKLDISDTLSYLKDKLSVDFKLDEGKIYLADGSVETKHIKSLTFDETIALQLQNNIPYKYYVDSRALVDMHLGTKFVSQYNIHKMIVDLNNMIFDNWGLVVKNIGDVTKFQVDVRDLIDENSAIRAELIDDIYKLFIRSGLGTRIGAITKGIDLVYNTDIFTIPTDENAHKALNLLSSDNFDKGIQARHISRKAVDVSRGIDKDIQDNGLFYMKISSANFEFSNTGQLKLKDNSVIFEQIDKGIFDTAKGIHIDTHLKKISFNISSKYFKFGENGDLMPKNDFLVQLEQNYIAKIRANGIDYMNNVEFVTSANNNIFTISLLNDTGKLNFKVNMDSNQFTNGIYSNIQTYFNNTANQILIENVSGLHTQLSQIDVRGQLSSYAQSGHKHLLNDITDKAAIMQIGKEYDNIMIANNGLFIRYNSGSPWRKLISNSSNVLELQTGITPIITQ